MTRPQGGDDRPEEGPVPARDRVPDRSARRGRPAPGSSRSPAGTARRGGPRTPPPPAAPAQTLVLGPVPVLARVAGLLLLLAGLVGAVAAFPTYLVVGGTAVRPVTGVGDALVALVWPVAAVAVGAGLALGRGPR